MTAQGPTTTENTTPQRRVRLDRTLQLFEHLRGIDHLRDARAIALERAIFTALAADRERFSDVLEFSFAITPRIEHAYRFSYAFPGFCASLPHQARPSAGPRALETDRAAAIQTALAAALPFGQNVVASVRKLLRAALDPKVMQPLIGIAWDRDGQPRNKVYLQFYDAPAQSGAHLTEHLLALPGLANHIGEAHLHMLGLDVGPLGLTSAKLYIAEPNLPFEGHVLSRALAIYRLTGGTPAPLKAPTDIDFGLTENSLTWSDVEKLPAIKALINRTPTFARLAETFHIQVRRVSLAIGTEPRLTVYYALREIEEAP